MKYIYTKEYYSVTKKNKIILFTATWMELEIIILSEVSHKETNTIWYHLYVESKIWHNELIYNTKNRHREQICGFQGVGEMKEGWTGSLGLADENLYRMGKQQGPSV